MKSLPLAFLFLFLAFSTAFGRFWLTPEDLTREAASQDAILTDWLLQDLAFDPAQGQMAVEAPTEGQSLRDSLVAKISVPVVQKVLDEIQNSTQDADALKRLDDLRNGLKALDGVPASDARWVELYVKAATLRRTLRLASLKAHAERIFFTKHHNLGGSHYAYTEALSDARAERHFWAGSQLCELVLNEAGECTEYVLLDDPAGMIRDPELTRDGKNLIFAWKRSDRLDDFHLWRMNLETRELTQLTFGLGWADYEPCVLPSGDVMFNSTRCVQTVDCFTTEVSNLYRMDAEGRFLRRVSFDQVHDNYPVLMNDGRVIYTRWDYNDRGQIFPQGLFQMNPDGTAQTALYGNNSWFPTTILHARPIPNTNGKILCVFSGHHTRQRGKLGVLDPNQGREEADGATLTAPFRETEPVHQDTYGQNGEQFCYPVPVTETECLVAYRPNANPNEWIKDRPTYQHDGAPFGIYFMNLDGRRELLAFDGKNDEKSCTQPIFKGPTSGGAGREADWGGAERPSMVDPSQETGVYYLQDVFYGPGLEGVDRKAVRSLRVVEIGYRIVWIGSNSNGGPAGGAMSATPISIGGGAWDPKRILGEAKIYEDGSACFRVPAKTPVYFQVIDQNGHVIQTMRSWSTLQPGETFSCIGCHEDKNSIAARGSSSLAMKAGPQELQPFYGPARWFSFEKEIQPILDRHCVRCHENSQNPPPFQAGSRPEQEIPAERLELLLPADCEWSFVTEKGKMADPKNVESWVNQFPLPNGEKGAGGFQHAPGAKSSWSTPEIWLTTEVNLPENYEPKPLFMKIFHDEDVQIYVNGTRVFDETGFLVRNEGRVLRKNPFHAGRNVVAAHCVQTGGGQGLSFALYSLKPTGDEKPVPVPEIKPFSLMSRKIADAEARRFWSESYLNLTNAQFVDRANGKKSPVVNWIGIQESPQMLEPYNSGAFSSSICTMFNEPNPHNGVKLTQEEKDRIAAWIDLLVPFCGDYAEAANWDENERKLHDYFLAKRKLSDAHDAQNYAAWAKNAPEECVTESQNPYRNLAPTAEKKVEGNVMTLTFPQAVKLDQVKIRLKKDAPSEQRIEVNAGEMREGAGIRPGTTGTFAVPNGQSTQNVTLTGGVEWIEKMEVFGFLEEKPQEKKE